MDATEHQPAIELIEDLPPELEAGGQVAVRLRVTCRDGCNLRNGVVKAVSADGTLVTTALAGAGPEHLGSTATLVLTVPARVGAWPFQVTFPEQEVAGAMHGACTLPVSSTVVPHSASVAVWEVPSPVQGARFTVQVGVKCSAGCRLGGQLVEVRDESGATVAEGRLGSEPSPGTSALHEAQVTLAAPDRSGVFSRTVHFAGTGLELPHTGGAGTFTFRVVEPPEHTVAVWVRAKGIEAPLHSIEVRLGPYGAMTDERGLASVRVAKGSYELSAWRVDIEPVSQRLVVADDHTVEVDAAPRRVVDEDAERWG